MRGLVIAAIALGLAAASVRWGSFVAGGSDSYCYVHQAERWADVLTHPGRSLQAVEPLALVAPWPDPPRTFAPTGHIASPTQRGAIVPICPAGLSIAMAPFVAIGGGAAAFAVLPLFAMLLVAATYTVGARFGARVGVASALLVACSPIVLYQAVQPMSDVPAAALWMAAVAAATGTRPRHMVLAGIATSAAILVRPNLVPLGMIIGVFLLLRPERTWSERLRAAATYALWCAPGCVAVALVQRTFYGSAFSSGYGDYDVLFAASHVAPNARRYASWLWQSHTPAIALAVLAPFLLPGPLTALFAALVLANVALYLPYVVFDDWSYLRFLLPTLPLLLILVAAVVDAVVRRLAFLRATAERPVVAPRAASIVLALAVVLLGIAFVREARARSTFRLQAMEARFAAAGRYVARRLPANAFIVTSYESGSVRFYGGRPTMLWSELDPAWLDRALDFARARGYEPYLLFERWEEPEFRRRFAATGIGALDWPPAAEVAAQVRIYRPGDRERFLNGGEVPTEYVP